MPLHGRRKRRARLARTIARWTRRLPAGLRPRIWFYEAPGIDVASTYGAWKEEGLGDPLVDPFSDFLDFNRLFANHLNEQIYQDHQGTHQP